MFLLLIPSLLTALIFSRAQFAMGGLPIGYDVSTSYLYTLLSEPIRFSDALQSQNLLYWILGTIKNFGIDELLLLKITGVILPTLFIASFTFLLYQFFPKKKALVCLAVVVVILQLATLRLSWDLYRNSLGLIFAMLGIALVMQGMRLKKIYTHIPLAFLLFALAYASHQMVVMALFTLGCITALWKITLSVSERNQNIILYILFPLVFVIGSSYVAFGPYDLRAPEPATTKLSRELFLFLFSSILPLVIIGAITMKRKILHTSTLLLLIVSLSPFISNTNPFYLWDRWMYFLAIPFGLYTAGGLLFLVEMLQKNLPKFLTPVLLVTLLATTLPGITFLISAKPSNTPFAKSGEDIFTKTPRQFLWNSIGFESTQDLEQAASVLIREHDGISAIYTSPQYLGFAHYYLPKKIHPFITATTQVGENNYKAPRKRYYIFGVNYGKFAEGKVLEGSSPMQPVQLYDASRP